MPRDQRWFATPDYRRVRCFRTSDDLVVDPDGSYTLLVGPDDPGHPNWIDSDGLTQGIFAPEHTEPEMTFLALLGDRGTLELEIVGDNASLMLGIRAGEKVVVHWA